MKQEKKIQDVPMGGGITFYIKVRDVKDLYNKVKKQVNIVLDLHRMFIG